MNVLNNIRKSAKERIGEALTKREQQAPDTLQEGQEEVTMEPVESVAEVIETTPVDYSNLSPEERRLREAQDALQAIIAQDGSLDDDTHNAEIEKAKRAMFGAQEKIAKARAEKEARFHEANRKVMEAQAEIKLAKMQKAEYDAVSTALQHFKQTDAGKNIPDDTAVVLSLLFEILPANTNPWQTWDNFKLQAGKILDRISAYYAHKKRVGLD